MEISTAGKFVVKMEFIYTLLMIVQIDQFTMDDKKWLEREGTKLHNCKIFTKSERAHLIPGKLMKDLSVKAIQGIYQLR